MGCVHSEDADRRVVFWSSSEALQPIKDAQSVLLPQIKAFLQDIGSAAETCSALRKVSGFCVKSSDGTSAAVQIWPSNTGINIVKSRCAKRL